MPAQAISVRELARPSPSPRLLAEGLRPWNGGHDLLLARHLLDDGGGEAFALPRTMPRAPVAASPRTDPRRPPSRRHHAGSARAASARRANPRDAHRLETLASLYRRYHAALEGRFADRSRILLRAARENSATCLWLAEAEILVVGDAEVVRSRRRSSPRSPAVPRSPAERAPARRPCALLRPPFGSWPGVSASARWAKTRPRAPRAAARPPPALAEIAPVSLRAARRARP